MVVIIRTNLALVLAGILCLFGISLCAAHPTEPSINGQPSPLPIPHEEYASEMEEQDDSMDDHGTEMPVADF